MADGRNTGAHSALDDDTTRLSNAFPKGISNFVRCIRSLGLLGPADHGRPSQQGLKLLRRGAVPRAGSKGDPMKLPRTIGLASPSRYGTVAAAQRLRPAPTANTVDADVSLIKPLPCN
jgi:hypothetical protein